MLFHLVQPKLGVRFARRLQNAFTDLASSPWLDLVVLGTGSKVRKVPPEIYAYLRKFKINLEVQDTVRFI